MIRLEIYAVIGLELYRNTEVGLELYYVMGLEIYRNTEVGFVNLDILYIFIEY